MNTRNKVFKRYHNKRNKPVTASSGNGRKKRKRSNEDENPPWLPEHKVFSELSSQQKWYYKAKYEGRAPYQKKKEEEAKQSRLKGRKRKKASGTTKTTRRRRVRK